MNLILAIPLAVRLALLFAVGAVAGAAVNWAVYRLAWNRRSIGPWSAAPKGAPRRRAIDRVPLFGWFALRREAPCHGRGFWVRPFLVELLAGAVFAALYLWETRHAPMYVAAVNAAQPPADFLTGNLALVAHLRYVAHAILVALMLAASLIDLDEKTIPDSITVPGTLLGLILAAAYPWSLPASGGFFLAGALQVDFLTLASPNSWPDALGGLPLSSGLLVGLGCWSLWCGGLLPRYWNARRGWGLAARVFFHRLRREPATYLVLAMWLAGAAAIALVAWRGAAASWAALATALVGVAVAGGIIWAVRIIAGAALGREAMGFGDVTLMSMIGAFLGWQAALVIFFVAPFFALAFAIANWVLHREREVPYGPFLCLGAATVMLQWPDFWERLGNLFGLPWLVPAACVCGLATLGLMLGIYRLMEKLLART